MCACSIPRPGSCCASTCAPPAGITASSTTTGRRAPLSTLALLRRADAAGPQIGVVCRHVQAHHGAHGVREVLGILALAKKHGPAVIDDAARVAVDVGVLSYRFIRKYIDRRPPLPLTLTQVDPLIRELARYRALIDQKTGDPT